MQPQVRLDVRLHFVIDVFDHTSVTVEQSVGDQSCMAVKRAFGLRARHPRFEFVFGESRHAHPKQ